MQQTKKQAPSHLEFTPPLSKDSEMMVLGCMLTSTNSLNTAAEKLNEEDFYFLENKTIFKAMQVAYKQDRPVDIIIVAENLKQQNKLDLVGGINYLTELAQFAGTAAYIEEYAGIIKEKALLRRMIVAAQTIENKAKSSTSSAIEVLDDAQQLLFNISQASSSQAGVEISLLLSGELDEKNRGYLQQLEEKQETFHSSSSEQSMITGIQTHFVDLDNMINGMSPSNLMILAARPAMGKTALALNIAENICFKNNIPVGIFSLEMTAEQLLHRIICSQAEVESKKIETGNLSGEEFQRIASTVANIKKRTMLIDDQAGLKVTDFRSRARRMKECHGIKFLIIDYLQLLSGSGSFKNQENRQSEISEISRMLKTTARELNLPILCLSQLSRKVEDRANHRPMMSDLRESGSIEQDSDLVMFLLRKEYYNPLDKVGQAELIVAKNRHGAVGSVMLSFQKELARFRNYSPEIVKPYSGQ